MSICIIPAKGQSQGIPHKNLQLVGSVTLLERAITAAKSSEYVTEVYVSTESDEVAKIAKEHKVEVIREPDRNFPTSEACLKHALESIERERGELAFIQCTSPFTTGAEIDACIKTRQTHGLDCVFTAVETHSGVWSRNYRNELVCLNHQTQYPREPRQTADKCYLETGAVYVMDIARFLETGTRFCGTVGHFLVSEKSSVDIDNPYDLYIARAVANMYEKRGLCEAEQCRCKTLEGEPHQWPSKIPPK